MHLLRMPQASENMTDGVVGQWFVEQGQTVTAGQPVVEIITEKAEFKLESEADGVLLRALAPEGSRVPVRFIVAVVGQSGEDTSAVDAENAGIEKEARDLLLGGGASPQTEPEPAAPPAPKKAVRATPAARRVAREQKIDLADVRDELQVKGAVGEKHVRRYLEQRHGRENDQAGGPQGIAGIGVDIVEVARIADLLERQGVKGMQRLFTPEEIAYCEKHSQAAMHFAGRFAVKEAVFKALGTGWGQGVSWLQVDTRRADSGQPCTVLSGTARERADALGVRRVHCSISHTADLAMAYVILER